MEVKDKVKEKSYYLFDKKWATNGHQDQREQKTAH
jgi:hypothetical protein